MQYGVKSKHDCVGNEKCPRCLVVFQHFIDLGEGLLACFKCGCVFVAKPVRDEIYEHILDILRSPVQVAVEASEFKAKCGRACKSTAGVKAHERHCDTCQQ